ncbi:MAG: type II toxin-antitoxin system HicA family toxin [Crocosphaera sp.]
MKSLLKKLRKLGFEFHRQAKGDHEIWVNTNSNL